MFRIFSLNTKAIVDKAIQGETAKKEEASYVEKPKTGAEALYNNIRQSLGQLNSLSPSDRQAVIEYMFKHHPSEITTLFKFYKGKDLIEMNLPGHLKNYIATLILREPNMTDKMFIANYVKEHPTYFYKSIKDDVEKLYADRNDNSQNFNYSKEDAKFNNFSINSNYPPSYADNRDVSTNKHIEGIPQRLIFQELV